MKMHNDPHSWTEFIELLHSWWRGETPMGAVLLSVAMTAQLLEQAAKEVGDVYTNKQKVEQNVIATHNVMPVPSCDNVDEWEAAAQKQQNEVLGG